MAALGARGSGHHGTTGRCASLELTSPVIGPSSPPCGWFYLEVAMCTPHHACHRFLSFCGSRSRQGTRETEAERGISSTGKIRHRQLRPGWCPAWWNRLRTGPAHRSYMLGHASKCLMVCWV